MPGARFRDGDVVELRTIEREDVDFLQRVINHPDVRATIAAAQPQNRVAEREWVESIGEEGDARFLVCVEGEPVGVIGLEPPNDVWGTAEVGYMLAPEEWGHGYATDALEAVCGYAFEERRLHKVYATAFETNPASRRVLEKAGFTEEGVLRQEGFADGRHVDLHRYGLLAEEWQERW